MELVEHAFTCPYCGAPISVLLDPSVPVQSYVEDCEVCCNPMQVAYAFEEDALTVFEAQSIEQ
ncbi:MAG: CPXCG motif-containing cysteine-rich protein [Bacteroidetes bacterium]|nr:CPXCG motif-containing cysteine-rich protein [Bacteroidota bacterium]